MQICPNVENTIVNNTHMNIVVELNMLEKYVKKKRAIFTKASCEKNI